MHCTYASGRFVPSLLAIGVMTSYLHAIALATGRAAGRAVPAAAAAAVLAHVLETAGGKLAPRDVVDYLPGVCFSFDAP